MTEYVHCQRCFYFLDIQVLREKQVTVSRDLEEKQTTCQQLQTSADELEVQIDSLSEERQRVRLYLHLNATSHLPVLFPLPFPLLLPPPPPSPSFLALLKSCRGGFGPILCRDIGEIIVCFRLECMQLVACVAGARRGNELYGTREDEYACFILGVRHPKHSPGCLCAGKDIGAVISFVVV